MMHSFGEYPREENESRLSQILEDRAHPKYCLSEKACAGILRRAEKRGKKLPEMFIVAAECGYQLENHHHALADAEACAWIAREIL